VKPGLVKKLAILLAAGAALSAHGFHSSLASLDYVSEAHSLQAILVVNAIDLETALRKESGRPIELDRTPDAAALTAAYVRKGLQLRSAGHAVPLRWVGMDVKTNFVYVYVEADVPTVATLEIRNSLLLDLLPDQVNMVSVRRDGKGKPFDCLFQQGTDYISVASVSGGPESGIAPRPQPR
jgi:hypothetical protein